MASNYIIYVSGSYLEEDMFAFLNTVAILKRLPNMHVNNTTCACARGKVIGSVIVVVVVVDTKIS